MKSILKKSMSLLLALGLTASLAVGCGSQTASEPTPESAAGSAASTEAAQSTDGAKEFANKELNIAVFQGAYGRDFWDALAQKFMEQYPGTKINITANPKLGEMIKPSIVAGNPPDFIYLNDGDPSGVTKGLIKDKAILDISDIFDSKALDKDSNIRDLILPGFLETPYCSPYGDGKIYLAPYNYGVMGLWYNKAYFDQKGYAAPKTWDEFFALNEKAKADGRALFTYQGIYPGYLEEVLIPAVYAAGGQQAVDDFTGYKEGFWKSEAAKKTLDIFSKIAGTDNALMKGTVALNHTQAQTAFMQGKSMFCVNGSWFEGEMKDAPREDGFQFGFAGVPGFNAGDPTIALVSVEQMYIPSKSKNPELAKEFMKFIYTDTAVRLNGEKAKAVMAVKGATEMVKEYITPSAYNCYKAVEEGMKPVVASLKPVANGSKINISDEIYKPFSSVMNRQMTVEEYADKLEKIYAQVRDELAKAQ